MLNVEIQGKNVDVADREGLVKEKVIQVCGLICGPEKQQSPRLLIKTAALNKSAEYIFMLWHQFSFIDLRFEDEGDSVFLTKNAIAIKGKRMKHKGHSWTFN